MIELVYPRRAVLLVAGLPGSGKTALLRRARIDAGVVVLDSDDVRTHLRRLGAPPALLTLLRPVVHLGHLARVVRAVCGPADAVVVHESGTRPRVRLALARLAVRTGRSCHAVFLDVDPTLAVAAQRRRGRRPVSEAGMARHERAWRVLRRRIVLGGGSRASDPRGRSTAPAQARCSGSASAPSRATTAGGRGRPRRSTRPRRRAAAGAPGCPGR